MSDFFMPNQNNQEIVDQKAEQYRNAANNIQNQQINEYQQKKQQHLENWDRYGVNVPDEYYDAFNKIIAEAPTPEAAQEEAYKIGSAVKYSEAMGIPLLEAYQNVDAFNEAQFTDLQGQKGRFEALSDMLNLGRNNVKLGRLGQELMQAHINNDTELANSLMAEIDAINQQNQLMQDNAPRSWVMQALEAGAQSLPFTGVVAGAGIVGNFIAPAAGTAASFAASSYLSAGTEYIDMIANGASPETARLVATVSGGIQGLIEADLGISKSIVKSTARVIGKEAAENAAKKSVEEIGRKVFKRFHFGAGKKVLLNYLENRGKDILGEGTEEFLQEITSIVGQEVAASLDGYDIPDDDMKHIVKQTAEAFRGGVLGALSMGFIPAGINAAADVREYKLIKDTAELFESEEMFKEAAKDSPVFEGMSDEAKEETIHEVWQRAQNRKEEAANLEAQKIAEGRDAAEGAEEAPAENEDGSTEANPVARNETGRLYTSDDVSTDDAGNVTGGTFVVGDKTKSENNRYGYIKYSQDAEGNITIDTFKMTEGRDKLRAEAFDEFAREHPDVNIEWNATAPDLQDFKNELIDANPSGKKNGLNYYSTTDLDNIQARKRVAEELRKNIHNIEDLGNNNYRKTELTNKQIAAGVTLIESAARRMGMGLNEYINKTFGNQIFGSREEFAAASLAQGEDVNKKAGGMIQGVAQANWREVGQQIKAVIYAGEHADFSTWAHEMAHVFQNQLEGQLKTDAENAFKVKGGDWYNSYYTFKDGRKMRSAEAFAWGFQDWLETGKAENEQMRNIFQKFAEFIADCYNRLKNHLDFTPEIESVFNQLLDGDDTIMSKALKAAQEQDNEYRASLKRQAEEKQAAKEAEKEEAKKQAEAAREEASEGTEFAEAAPTAEELLNGIEEAENETKETTEETNAIDNALENTNLTDEQKDEISEVLNDASTTVVEKAEATTEAAESAYEPYDLFQNEGALLSQLIGEESIQKMVKNQFREDALEKLDYAKLLDRQKKDADTIKLLTNWEKNDRGVWQYETDDRLSRIKISENIIKELRKDPNYLVKLTYGKEIQLKDLLDANELYAIFPDLRNITVTFYKAADNIPSEITGKGFKINTALLLGTDGEHGLKGRLVHELQHLIQRYENAASTGVSRDKIYQIAAETMGKLEAESKGEKYDTASLDEAVREYMLDEGEIEARNVARRVLLTANERLNASVKSTEDLVRAEYEEEKKAQQSQTMHYQTIQDPDLLEKLNSEPTIKVYRAMQVIDGEYYPPMATVVEGKRVESAKAGDWIQADENPELAVPDIDKKTGKQKVDKDGNLKWKFVLDKGGKDSSGKALTKIPAAYNPYWHTSRSPLNDQFSSAYKRPNLVTVQVEVPESELTSGYRAERAKDAVGEMDWHSGPVSSQLAAAGKPRKVILSRYCKIDRVIPDSEVAQKIKDLLEGTDIAIPDNTITPSLKAELEKIGVKVEETEDVRDYNKDLEEATKKAQDLLFQNELTMYGIHNLSEEALRHAVKMGGLANPSMAVVDTEKNSFTNFGEVSLIPYNYMLEKGEGSKGTFGADIYSPRYPSLTINVTDEGYKTISSIVEAVKAVDENFARELEGKIANGIEYHGERKQFLYEYFRIPFLAEKGYKDFYHTPESKFSDEIRKEYKKLWNKEEGAKTWRELYEQFIESEYDKELVAELKEDLKDSDKEYNLLSAFEHQLWQDNQYSGKIDYGQTERKAEEIIDKDPELKKEFEKYVDEKLESIDKKERIFNGFTPSGNRRYLEHTLENVSKYMRQQELQGGENFYYGLGSTRAKFTPNFKTLNQIKKARDRLVTKEEFEKIKEEYEERFDNIIEELRGEHDFDVGAARFEEAFQYGKSDPIGYLENEYNLSIDDELAQEILDFATALRTMPTEYFETKFTRPVTLNEFAGAIIPSNLAEDLKEELKKDVYYIEEYDPQTNNREEVTKAALNKWNETRRILFQDDDIQQQINETMTMEKAKDMIQRTFNLANIKEWYDGEYKTGDEWAKDRGADEVAMYVDNEWQIQEKFLNNIPALIDGEIVSADIIQAYLDGTLTGPQQQNKETYKPVDLSVDTGFTDNRFYAPQRIDTDARELLEKASVKVTDANKKEVFKARADFITAAHDPNFVASLGMTQAAVNKKLQSWAAYPANAAKISNSINKDASLQNKWTGIVNSNLLKSFTIEKEQLESMVKEVKGDPSEYQLSYITSTILALDTHIDFSRITYEFTDKMHRDGVAGSYDSNDRTVRIKNAGLNTVAHETGHALDHLWGNELFPTSNIYLTERQDLNKITDPAAKNFVQHFYAFMESIEDVSDIRSGYTQKSTEVFARFVARFTEWTRNVATNNRFNFEKDWYDDKFTTQQFYEFAKILQEKSALDTTKQKLLSQEVYHGSGADFDKFDTENFGLSGEGTMSFGYGTYLTDNEDIARDYAERQSYEKDTYKLKPEYKDWDSIVFDILVLDHSVKKGEDFKQVKEQILKNLQNDLEKKKGSGYPQRFIEWAENDVNNFNSLNSLEDIEKLFENRGRYLYTVEIPDDGYLDWKEEISVEDAIKIANKFITYAERNKLDINAKKLELPQEWSYDGTITGQDLYIRLDQALYGTGTEKTVSRFLNSIGYAGIKYPAGTIHGNGNGAYNYVIFNDDDAQIVDKLLFQTNAELMDEAKTFDSWQEFMDYCEAFHADDDVSPIPGDADAQWYQTFWETSNGVQVEQEKNEEAIQAKNKKEGALPGAVDALFTTMIRSDPQMVDSFLQAVAELDAIDLDSEEWQQAESAEDAAQREQIEKLKDFIGITLSDYNWQTALKRIQGGHEISEGLRKRLIGEMTDSFKSRDFRALYAEVMIDPQFAVAEEDSITASLNKKLKKYHDIVKPTDDISRWSPEKRKQLAEQLANREIAAKIRSGSLKLDDELDAYIKSLNKQIKETQDQYNELEKETKADYQRIADKERRDLLKLHEQLLLARGKLNSRNTEINRKIAKGLKITDKYSRLTQNLNANYDELFRKYNDLRNTITINAEVQAALDRQEQVAGLRDDLNAKQKEKNLTAEVKKMRIQLVKRAMRRVPFNRIDYNNARTVIAIQRMLEPNLLGGVNRFIGIDSPYLRGVISQIVTDSDYKEKIMNYLSKNTKASQAFADFKKKLEELKSIKDFDSWTAKDRKAAIRYLPKENWVRDLNLKELAKEREESIDLDIGMEEVKRTVYDEKTGEPKTYKDNEGNSHNVTETAFRLKYDEELGRLVQDAVGADMFDKIVNMPFSEWTTEDLETLAQRIDEIYTEGRDLKAAKDEARKNEAAAIRKRIEDAIKETGITINDDDTPEEKERKQKQIDKILGMSSDLKGTEAGKTKGFMAKITRLLHSYSDMNVLRFGRMLDGQSEGENVRLLYRMEDDCYNKKQRSMNSRAEKIYKVMKDNNITEGDLAEVIKVPSLGTEFTVDELLYFLAADKDYAEDEKKLQRGLFGIDANDDYAATSRNAVMFGNMMSDMMSQEEKESWLKLDKDMEKALQNDTLTQEQKEQLAAGQLDKKPGTTRYIMACHAKWEVVLGAANNYLSTHPEYKALMEAIEADYAEQYGRMNEVSINEFNMPVHRVKAYVPLVRRESNGDTNENQVREDLLGTAGVGKQWVNKGMTQRRVNISPLNQKPVQTGLFRTWGDSIERTEHFIAYAPYVRQLNAVYKSRDASYTRRYIESRYGAGAIKYLDEYINEVANPNAGRIRERGAEWLHVLRGKTAPAYLGWKASAIIKQGLTSPWPYMQFVTPAEYVSAAMKFTFNPEMREAIKEKSVFMKMRRMDPVNDLIDEMADSAKTKLDRGWSNFSKLGMQGLELIDWACVAPGWLACYEKKYNQLQNASNARYEAKMAELKERNMYADVGTSEYLTPQQMEAEAKKEMLEDIEAEAVRYADDCTRACQPSNRVTDLAPLFKNSSEAMKAFLQFQTSLNVIWQNIRYDMPYAVKNKEFTRIAGTVIGYVCAGIFMNSVMEGLGGDDDDDETQALRNLLYYSTTQFTDAIPIMGSEITNTMDQLITGKRGFYGSGTDMTPSATKLLSALTNAKKGNWEKAASITAEGIGLYLGAPVSGAKEINKLLGKPLSEGDVNLKRGISDVYGIAGDILEE